MAHFIEGEFSLTFLCVLSCIPCQMLSMAYCKIQVRTVQSNTPVQFWSPKRSWTNLWAHLNSEKSGVTILTNVIGCSKNGSKALFHHHSHRHCHFLMNSGVWHEVQRHGPGRLVNWPAFTEVVVANFTEDKAPDPGQMKVKNVPLRMALNQNRNKPHERLIKVNF